MKISQNFVAFSEYMNFTHVRRKYVHKQSREVTKYHQILSGRLIHTKVLKFLLRFFQILWPSQTIPTLPTKNNQLNNQNKTCNCIILFFFVCGQKAHRKNIYEQIQVMKILEGGSNFRKVFYFFQNCCFKISCSYYKK